MWKAVPDRPLAIAAAAGLLLLLEAGYTFLGGHSNRERTARDTGTAQLLQGGEGGPAAAVESARQALEWNPALGQRWCDLAEALLDAGDGERAANCFQRAEELAPAIPEVLLRALYGAARQGRETDQIRLAHRVLSLVRTYDSAVFGLYVNSSRELAGNLSAGFPDAAVPEFLRFLLSAGDFELAADLWRWASGHRSPADSLALEYAAALCQAGRRAEARRMWAAHTQTPAEALWNGDWESERPAGALDWNLHAPAPGRIARDCSHAAEGRCSLRITVDWPDRHFFEGVEQSVALEPGAYRLTARILDEGETGFGLRAFGPGFDQRAIVTPGPASTWRMASVTFRLNAAADVRVQMIRLPGSSDGPVRGTVWIDSVRISRL